MTIVITPVQVAEYPKLISIWQSSVTATHHFLTEQAIVKLRPLVLNEYLPMVTLYCSRNNKQQITGFAGVNENRLEMLFIDPNYRGQGIGKALLRYAIEQFNVNELDVNEQNPQAVGFYQHQGFKITGRSPLDGQGQPYPLLHMRL